MPMNNLKTNNIFTKVASKVSPKINQYFPEIVPDLIKNQDE